MCIVYREQREVAGARERVGGGRVARRGRRGHKRQGNLQSDTLARLPSNEHADVSLRSLRLVHVPGCAWAPLPLHAPGVSDA